MRVLLTLICALFAALPCARAQPGEQTTVAKAVLVTGASSGIGRKITEHLAADGYFVYATARKEEDLKALGAIRNVHPLRLDVTQPADIAAAVEAVTKAGHGLYGLVNNAGVATFGTIANMRMEEFDLTMKVNAQIKKVVQWNEGHAHTFDRATLIKMLDDELSTARPRTE